MKALLEKKITYDEALAYLNKFQFHGFKLGLERMEAILEAMGMPHQRYPCIHVAGTNGKGSTCAFLSSILVEAGIKTALYTSPHLFSLTERFKIDNEAVSKEELADLILEIKKLVEKGYELSYFEFTTVIAMTWFARQGVDAAIFETGLGGRLDATNVTTPLLSVITNISLDHQAYLGNTITEIAWEKAGIIKTGRPVVSGVRDSKAAEVIERRCMELNAPLYQLDKDFTVESRDLMHMDYKGHEMVLHNACLGLPGSHQALNAALAAMSSEILARQGWQIGDADVKTGLAKAKWPGRGEMLQGRCTVLLDGAHNLDGVQRLKDLVKGLGNVRGAGRGGNLLLWACSNEGGGKDFYSMLKEAAPMFDAVVITEPPGPRNPVTIDEWSKYRDEIPVKAVLIKDWRRALNEAVDSCRPKGLLCVAGSLYLVGAARRKLLDKGWRSWTPPA